MAKNQHGSIFPQIFKCFILDIEFLCTFCITFMCKDSIFIYFALTVSYIDQMNENKNKPNGIYAREYESKTWASPRQRPSSVPLFSVCLCVCSCVYYFFYIYTHFEFLYALKVHFAQQCSMCETNVSTNIHTIYKKKLYTKPNKKNYLPSPIGTWTNSINICNMNCRHTKKWSEIMMHCMILLAFDSLSEILSVTLNFCSFLN